MMLAQTLRVTLGLLALALGTAGCSSVQATRAPNFEVERVRTVFVERLLSDQNGVFRLIEAELTRRGYEVSAGFPVQMPERGIDAVVSYQDRWAWDFRDYMVELAVTVRDPRTQRMLASSRWFRPGLSARAPETMVRGVVGELFPPRRGGA
jgi:hypothetical protein